MPCSDCQKLCTSQHHTAQKKTKENQFLGIKAMSNEYKHYPKTTIPNPEYSYLQNLSEVQYGFIPDIIKTLQAYNLTNSIYISMWPINGFFPGNHSLKRITKKTVTSLHKDHRQLRMNTPYFAEYSTILGYNLQIHLQNIHIQVCI